MKRYIRPAAAVLAIATSLIAGTSIAGNIQFNGQVTAETCKSDVFGSTNQTIYLENVAASEFGTASGIIKGITDFTIRVSGCAVLPNAAKTFTVGFQAGTQTNAAGQLVNMAPSGSDVVLGIFSDAAAGTPIDLSGGAVVTNGVPTVTVAAGDTGGTQTYYVAYVSTSTATTEGPVYASLNYVVSYQ
jgi:major type 1 subunit fimbrin (pilin)